MSGKVEARTDRAPEAVGPYSQGIRADGFVFSSGQLPMTPSGRLIGDDISKATRQALDNLLAVFQAAGASVGDVVKVTIYLTDMSHFEAVNAVYKEAFAAPYPARSCVAVAALPKGAPIEIEAVAKIHEETAG